MTASERLILRLGQARFVYLGLLPSLATFALVVRGPVPGDLLGLLTFLGGVVFVAGYMWGLTFVRPSRSLLGAVAQLFAAPFFALLSRPEGGTIVDLAIRGFLVDGLAMVLAVVWLGMTRSSAGFLPRAALATGAAITLAAVAPLFAPTWQGDAAVDWRRWVPIAVGVAQSFVVMLSGLRAEQGRKLPTDGAARLGPLTFLWVLSMMGAYGYVSIHAGR